MEEVLFQAPQVATGLGSKTMLAPQEVQEMLALSALGCARSPTPGCTAPPASRLPPAPAVPAELLRPLQDYQEVIGGGW